ncbi:MAG: hypothetical protein ACHRXM_31640 [Isosphaerales bacterium]
MAELSTGAAARPLDVLLREGTLGGLSDAQLLERFLASGVSAEAAFDVLMARHGPMVLGVCRRILQGRTIAEASRQLGWPAGTVGGCLARARDRLHDRLVRRGLVAPAALAAALAPDPACAAAVPRSLARSTHAAALQLAAGRAATAVVTATVANLLEETMRTMAWTRVMSGATAGALLGALVLGAARMSLPSTSPGPAPQEPRTQTAGAANPERPASTPLTRTLLQASQAASTLSDPQERVDSLIAVAWAQIKSGDRAGARAGLDRAVDASCAFIEAEPRCISRVRIAQARGEAGDRHGGLTLLTLALEDAQLIGRRSWKLKSIAVAQCELGAAKQAGLRFFCGAGF